MKGPSRILGQECAELLGAVLKEKDFLDKVARERNKAIRGDTEYTVGSACVIDRAVLANRHNSRTSSHGTASWPMSAALMSPTITWSN